MIKLYDIQCLCHIAVVHSIEGHCIRPNGNMHIRVQDLSLHPHKIHMAFILFDPPFQHQMRVMPCMAGGGDLLEGIVPLAE